MKDANIGGDRIPTLSLLSSNEDSIQGLGYILLGCCYRDTMEILEKFRLFQDLLSTYKSRVLLLNTAPT